jgi:hypothetical protein
MKEELVEKLAGNDFSVRWNVDVNPCKAKMTLIERQENNNNCGLFEPFDRTALEQEAEFSTKKNEGGTKEARRRWEDVNGG